MNKRERVLAVIHGCQPDKIPAGFWLHFPAEAHYGPNAVTTHLDFFQNSQTDIGKVMNENLIPKDPALNTAADWSDLRPLPLDSDYFRRQVELVRQVADSAGRDAVVLATIHGVVASASHLIGGPTIYDTDRNILARHLRENPAGMRHGLQIVADYLAALTRACLEAGADGIYYAALGGERTLYTDDQFAEFIRPLDLQVLAAAAGRKGFNVLHLCKDGLNLDRFRDYPGEVVNWGIYADNPGLSAARDYFPDKIVLGGLDDRSGVLVDGNAAEITAAVHDILDRIGDTPFILGADCTLPAEIDLARIRTAIAALNSYRR